MSQSKIKCKFKRGFLALWELKLDDTQDTFAWMLSGGKCLEIFNGEQEEGEEFHISWQC